MPRRATTILSSTLVAAGLIGCHAGDSTKPATPGVAPYAMAEPSSKTTLEVVHEFNDGAMPTGVTVSQDGRVFVNFPRWEDPVQFTVGEIKNGKVVAYPDQAANAQSPDKLYSVQSVVVDPKNRLWALDTGSINMEQIKDFNWPKLVCVDLESNKIVKTIRFPEGVIHKQSYLNDVRFDLRRGAGGFAFITDSSAKGANGIIVVDLESGRSWRKLNDHPTTKAEKDFDAVMEGKPVRMRQPAKPEMPVTVGADGIAIDPAGGRLFYCPLIGRSLSSVGVDALVDEKLPDEKVAATVKTEERKFASDGLESDAAGNVYLTDWEHNAINVRQPDGTYKTLVNDARLWWPDTLSVAADGYLYVTANQLHRQGKFNWGNDLRQKPYYLFRYKIDAKPVLLK